MVKSPRVLALIVTTISSAIVFFTFFSTSLIKSNSSLNYPITTDANFRQIDLSPLPAISEFSNLHRSDSSVSPQANPVLISTHFNPPENTSGSPKISDFDHKTRGESLVVKENKVVFANLTSTKVIELPSNNGEEEKTKKRIIEDCDVTKGKWVYDSDYQLYTNESCPFIDEGFACQSNGRLDLSYMNWRWEPQDCDAPRFIFYFLVLLFSSIGVLMIGW